MNERQEFLSELMHAANKLKIRDVSGVPEPIVRYEHDGNVTLCHLIFPSGDAFTGWAKRNPGIQKREVWGPECLVYSHGVIVAKTRMLKSVQCRQDVPDPARGRQIALYRACVKYLRDGMTEEHMRKELDDGI